MKAPVATGEINTFCGTGKWAHIWVNGNKMLVDK